jgi:hypothetical protein
VLESRVLRIIFGPNNDMTRAEDNYIIRRFIICTVHSVLLRQALQDRGDSRSCMTEEGGK